MAYYYPAPAENKAHISTAKSEQPVLNGEGTKFSNGSTKPVTVSAPYTNKIGSNTYFYGSTLYRLNTSTTNVDTIRAFYPNQTNFGTEYTNQSLYSADPQKLRIAIY